MTPPGKPAVFLERANYRLRRLGDAARCLPVLGAVLWLIPLLWERSGDAAQSNANMLTYIFVIWVVLIILAAVLARVLPDNDPKPDTTRR